MLRLTFPLNKHLNLKQSLNYKVNIYKTPKFKQNGVTKIKLPQNPKNYAFTMNSGKDKSSLSLTYERIIHGVSERYTHVDKNPR